MFDVVVLKKSRLTRFKFPWKCSHNRDKLARFYLYRTDVKC